MLFLLTLKAEAIYPELTDNTQVAAEVTEYCKIEDQQLYELSIKAPFMEEVGFKKGNLKACLAITQEEAILILQGVERKSALASSIMMIKVKKIEKLQDYPEPDTDLLEGPVTRI